MLLFVIPYIYIFPCFSLIFTDFLCFFPLLLARNLRTGNKHNKIKREEKVGIFNISRVVSVSGTHAGIAGTTTPRTVITVCYTSTASLWARDLTKHFPRLLRLLLLL
jgi:hypothetical protein